MRRLPSLSGASAFQAARLRIAVGSFQFLGNGKKKKKGKKERKKDRKRKILPFVYIQDPRTVAEVAVNNRRSAQ